MPNSLIFEFKSSISECEIPEKLNNPFGFEFPEIVQLAAEEFQAFIATQSANWDYDFNTQKGKMFGVLVIQKPDGNFGYLAAMSGKLPNAIPIPELIPSVFQEPLEDVFFTQGMTELTQISQQIKTSENPKEIEKLTEFRKQKSFALQQKLFENYHFLTEEGNPKNVLEIFSDSSHGNPPAAAGECAAPKLLNFAFQNQLKPIAIAEFWWEKKTKAKKEHTNNFTPLVKTNADLF